MNGYCGGVFQEAVSGVTHLNNDWYDGKEYQTYAFEYAPGGEGDGYVTWYVGADKTWTLDARSLGPNGNVGSRTVSQEPMYVIANFGMSNGFALVNLTGLAPLMPATMRIDYIRIYQDEGDELVTCDPPDYSTTDYIANHPEAYFNPNLTTWYAPCYMFLSSALMIAGATRATNGRRTLLSTNVKHDLRFQAPLLSRSPNLMSASGPNSSKLQFSTPHASYGRAIDVSLPHTFRFHAPSAWRIRRTHDQKDCI